MTNLRLPRGTRGQKYANGTTGARGTRYRVTYVLLDSDKLRWANREPHGRWADVGSPPQLQALILPPKTGQTLD